MQAVSQELAHGLCRTGDERYREQVERSLASDPKAHWQVPTDDTRVGRTSSLRSRRSKRIQERDSRPEAAILWRRLEAGLLASMRIDGWIPVERENMLTKQSVRAAIRADAKVESYADH